MKKSIVLFLSLILVLNIFVISIIKAETPAVPDIGGNVNPETGLPSGVGDIKDVGDKLTDEQQRSQYLKQEWGKILANNKFFGPIITAYGTISPYTDPISKYTLGSEPSLTWLFFLTLVLWIAFVVYALRILELTSIFSKWVQYIISFGVVIIISITGITRKIAEYIINAISILTTWWMQLIVAGIVIVAIILASVFSKNLQGLFKAMKEKKEKNEEEMSRARLKSDIKVAEEFTKEITE